MSAENLTEEDIRSIVREELENSDGSTKSSRRNVLKALGVAGAGAALGGGSTAALTQEASAATDAGDIGTPTDRYDLYAGLVDTEQLSSSVTFAHQYSTFSDAVSAAQGGILFLTAQEFDVANYGRLLLGPSDGVSVVGVPGDIVDGYGTRIVNTGSDRVTSGPIVQVDGDATTQRANRTIQGIAVNNDASVAGFEVRDAPHTMLVNCQYNGPANSQTDTTYNIVGESWKSRLMYCGGTADDVVYNINHNGGDVELYGCDGVSRNGNAAEIKGDTTTVVGGDFSAGNGIGILVTGDYASIQSPRFENCNIAFQFGTSTTRCLSSVLDEPSFGNITTALVKWDDTSHCRLEGVRNTVGTTNGFEFTLNTGDPYLEIGPFAAERTLTDGGASNPNVQWAFTVPDSTTRDAKNVKAAGTRVWHDGASSMQVWDGASWVAY